jgi:cytochrome c553
MASHQWAAARMWEGLIGPSDDRWLEGARTMARSRTTIIAESGELGIADDAARTRLLAERATRLGDPDERATLYGEMLATCAHCHHAIRDR